MGRQERARWVAEAGGSEVMMMCSRMVMMPVTSPGSAFVCAGDDSVLAAGLFGQHRRLRCAQVRNHDPGTPVSPPDPQRRLTDSVRGMVRLERHHPPALGQGGPASETARGLLRRSVVPGSHAVNTVLFLMDSVASRSPLYMRHLYQPFIYVAIYMVFNVVYCTSGGRDGSGNRYVYGVLQVSQVVMGRAMMRGWKMMMAARLEECRREEMKKQKEER
jgi:hypothetical protein